MNYKAEHSDMLSFPYESGVLVAFAKLRKETITFVMSVRLSSCPRPHEQLGSHWTDVNKI